MSIKVNEKGLKNSTKPKLAATVSNLATARSNISGLQMPDNFSYATQLNKEIPSQISQIEKNVSGIISYINEKVKEFERVQRSIKNVSLLMNQVELGGKYEVKDGKIVDKYPNRFSSGMTNNQNYTFGNYNQTGSKVSSNKVSNSQEPIIFQWAKWVKDKANKFDLKKTMKNAKEALGGAKQGVNVLLAKAKKIDLKKTAATIGNMNPADFMNLLIGGGKGALKAGEEISDAYQIMSTNSFENNPDVLYYYNGNKKKIKEGQKQLQRDTMGMVSVQHVDTIFNNFYNNTKMGTNLDKNAHEYFKSNGKWTNWIETRAHQGAIFTIGGAAGPLGVGVLGGMAAKGKTAENMWVSSDVKSLINNGADIDILNNVYEKADKYSSIIGTYTGASMAFQKSTGSGGKIDKVLNNPIKRIFADAAVGSTEPMVNAWAESTVTGKSFAEIFDKNGGWNAVGAAFTGAGFDSLVGEVKGWAINKGNSIIKESTGIDLLYEKQKLKAEIKNAAKNAWDDIINPKDRIIADPGLFDALDNIGNSIKKLFNRNKNTNSYADERTRILDQAIYDTMIKHGLNTQDAGLWQQYRDAINNGNFSVISSEYRQTAYNAFYRINGNQNNSVNTNSNNNLNYIQDTVDNAIIATLQSQGRTPTPELMNLYRNAVYNEKRLDVITGDYRQAVYNALLGGQNYGVNNQGYQKVKDINSIEVPSSENFKSKYYYVSPEGKAFGTIPPDYYRAQGIMLNGIQDENQRAMIKRNYG